MDPLSEVLTLLKPASFGFRGLDARGAWRLEFGATGGIKAFAVEAGTCWMTIEGGEPTRLGPGDMVLLPGRTAFRLFSSDGAEPIDAYPFFSSVPVGTVASLHGGGECFGVGGFFDFEGRHAALILDVLPSLIMIRAETTRAALGVLIGRLMKELREPQPGGALIAAHLAQSLLIEALRLHLADDSANGRGWLAGLRDRRIGSVLAAMHADPARAWTLVDLSRTAGMSRSSFAARFKQVVGEGALEYLTRWRMIVAADKLAQGRTTLAAVAPMVGYASESAFGMAFKRVLGQSPRQFVNHLGSGCAIGPG
ncbi:AraC family transcriptional regulator [Luteibacter sahnii]|jgi:AraC-like DNA-binding protein|uniref:AraC family transcriptional regulator n=1 Tax=Luteibacter sahnii TaxID=3021977 RepID=UPI002A6B1B3C|nr:AraC family transcriptional regulator [Luteibacter sp. PPL193]MDY1547687.1 AraC family transcriptional regulator [Luteibacter sp. PPL193]